MNETLEAIVRKALNKHIYHVRDPLGFIIEDAVREAWELAIRQEREACAKVAEDLNGVHDTLIAKSIRARGEED